jgi:integrase
MMVSSANQRFANSGLRILGGESSPTIVVAQAATEPDSGRLAFRGELQPPANRNAFAAFLRILFREDWVVYSKPPFGGPEHVPQYLARYTHRVAICIRRTKGTAKRQVTPALKDDIRDMVKALPFEDPNRATRLRAIRDRAMILIGFGAALRSAELVALDFGDLAEAPERGLVVSIRRSKTDQTGEGRMVAIAAGRTPATDTVTSLGAWLDESKIETGGVFRGIDRHGRILGRLTTRAVALLIKERAAAAGIDPEKYSSHSLRAGLATSAALAGATELQITQQTGHKSTAMVKQYVRVADIWRDNVTEKIGL